MGKRVLIALIACALLMGAGRPPWRARRRSGVRPNLRAAELIDVKAWGREPESPASVDPQKLAHALVAVCGPMPKGRATDYASFLLDSARRHGEDPFLLGALMYRASRCLPDAKTVEGFGLTAIQPRMYLENARGRKLLYPVSQGGALATRSKELHVGFSEESLLLAQANLEWAAALLAMWRDQHEDIHAHFEQVKHRHHVSHFIWGDRVRSARAEDRIMLDRRRLLMHYGVPTATPTQLWRGMNWGSPLEASPRVVSSQPGADRDEGLRAHHGVDIEATFGEPVFALATGRVAFAGVDLPGHARNMDLSPSKIAAIPRSELGSGGRYVCITHLDQQEDEAWLRSCYMHLETVHVRAGQSITRGQLIGTVGRTGMKSSAPHLHLEIKSDKRLYDAREILAGVLIGKPPPEPKRKRRKKPRIGDMLVTHVNAAESLTSSSVK